MTEAKFTWLPKFTATLERVPEEQRGALLWALAQYGTHGIEPTFEDWALQAVFEGLREDIDNNKSFRGLGKTGGRGNRKAGGDALPQPDEGFAGSEIPVCGNETPVSQIENGGNEKSPSIPYQSIPDHTNPNQTKPKGGARFRAPTVEEVRQHCREKGYAFDPEAFVAFYESNGWRVGKNPMKSWKAACVTWQRREGPTGKGERSEYSDL